MSRSPAKSGKAIATKLLKEKWLSIVQSAEEKGENGIGGSSTVTFPLHFPLMTLSPIVTRCVQKVPGDF